MTVAPRTIADLLAEARKRFDAAGVADPVFDARLLVSGILGLSLADILLKGSDSVADDVAQAVLGAIARRETGEPVHRILGQREFYGLEFFLSSGTLEPRPDTETLVDTILPYLRSAVAAKGSAQLLDMGTGTGAICLSLIHECPGAEGVGSDISEDALATAWRNAVANGVSDRFKTVKSHWFDKIEGSFDIIVSNPPYIRSSVIETLDRDVREFDPMAALDGGPDGLEPYRAIARGAGGFLTENGIIGVEIGFDQRQDVETIFKSAGFPCIAGVKDYGGNDRVLVFRK